MRCRVVFRRAERNVAQVVAEARRARREEGRHRGVDETGTDRSHADIVRAELEGGAAGEHLQARLGRAIGSHTFGGLASVDRDDVDDAASGILRRHVSGLVTDATERRGQADLHDRGKPFRRLVTERDGRRRTDGMWCRRPIPNAQFTATSSRVNAFHRGLHHLDDVALPGDVGDSGRHLRRAESLGRIATARPGRCRRRGRSRPLARSESRSLARSLMRRRSRAPTFPASVRSHALLDPDGIRAPSVPQPWPPVPELTAGDDGAAGQFCARWTVRPAMACPPRRSRRCRTVRRGGRPPRGTRPRCGRSGRCRRGGSPRRLAPALRRAVLWGRRPR